MIFIFTRRCTAPSVHNNLIKLFLPNFTRATNTTKAHPEAQFEDPRLLIYGPRERLNEYEYRGSFDEPLWHEIFSLDVRLMAIKIKLPILSLDVKRTYSEDRMTESK